MITPEKLREIVSYDPETGVFTWRKTRGRARAGNVAGTPHNEGYISIVALRGRYLAHRLAWFYVHGEWPQDDIDHINGDRSDNRISNLRDVSRSENLQNVATARKSSTHGFIGASRQGGRWKARIKLNGKETHLGLFDTPEEASEAYLRAKAEMHPASARL